VRQEINLYGPALLGPRERFSARQLGIAFLLALVILLLFGLWQQWRQDQVRARADALEVEVAALGTQVERVAATLVARGASDALARQVERLERERDGKRALLERISDESLGNTAGFSAQLEGLGRRHPEGLWLQHIHLSRGGSVISLAGNTLRAELLPRYLRALAEEPVFVGTTFDTFSLQRPEGARTHSFTLVTPCIGADGSRLRGEDCLRGEEGR